MIISISKEVLDHYVTLEEVMRMKKANENKKQKEMNDKLLKVKNKEDIDSKTMVDDHMVQMKEQWKEWMRKKKEINYGS